ncbi:sugar ABC transporter permease [Paenibacillus psychroresistens]|uniref:Sugar ABC transporter permease n=1 Tax=Paenibacillus psychroresistens TaxID=1778678 RepID=A0A6B8RI11_9BACL|nr:sugar ABC transporter permease [Paenibacillus psychroresistens]QGQ95016.1 sugar ABC transporter permease [Paenibacillus psychroresistens]
MKKGRLSFSIMFLAPALFIYTLFMMIPVASSAYYSLTLWNGIFNPKFIGLDNYMEILHDSNYWLVAKNTLTLILFTLVFQVPPAIIIAYILFKVKVGFKFFRSVYFLPVVVAPIAIGIMFSLFYNGDFGPINKFFDLVGLSSWKHNWLSDIKVVLYSVMFPQVWQYIGLFIVIILAALMSIPEDLFESAKMDGATVVNTFFRIVVPLIWDVIQVCMILAVTGTLKSFDHTWAITQGGPGLSSAYLAVYIYQKFITSDFGYASAITITVLIYALAFTVILKRFFSKEAVQY